MLRTLTLACLILVAAPASATESPNGSVRGQAPETSATEASNAAMAQGQENKAPPQAPKRDCERKQEGVSA